MWSRVKLKALEIPVCPESLVPHFKSHSAPAAAWRLRVEQAFSLPLGFIALGELTCLGRCWLRTPSRRSVFSLGSIRVFNELWKHPGHTELVHSAKPPSTYQFSTVLSLCGSYSSRIHTSYVGSVHFILLCQPYGSFNKCPITWGMCFLVSLGLQRLHLDRVLRGKEKKKQTSSCNVSLLEMV